jgi:DNA-binding transcriptional ArsR family regulator
MPVITADARAAQIAAAIGEPARARMLYSLSDGRARTSTELAAIAGVTPSTASVHLQRLKDRDLVTAVAQGKHRYYTLAGPHVAAALEALSVVAHWTGSGQAASTGSGRAGDERAGFVAGTPEYLRAARTCYDHLAGTLGVRLHDRFLVSRWLKRAPVGGESYEITAAGTTGFASIGIDVGAVRSMRRRVAFPCLDWSERRAHLGGALAAALLDAALRRRWISREPGSRALTVTASGRRELAKRFGVTLDAG